MKSEPFVIERIYNAPVKRVWEAITTKEQMKQWYFDIIDFKAEKGAEFHFYGIGPEGEKFKHLCKVTEVTENQQLTYSWRYEGFEGNSFVSFELFPEGDKTRVKLTHAGLETFPQDNASFKKENFAMGWTQLIGTSLREFVEQA
ncbi:SRPBCC domain-containing protein [Chitinophaga pinensis]|uniref:SRPBCC domain-containing protein n=1 Tax=Chitinophaga pinensis TaxID=79329 RepID=A0A5C6LN71_9BACT|nr:SRPBCC domain-containing protein [Chitinophaga pinensis]TWV97370.1 SRPBCC domain-containing protein [Chitinophaga pinensis]